MDSIVQLDDHDRELVGLLQEDARANYQTLATRTGLSPATVRRRVERLISTGAVQLVAVPYWSRLGFNLVAFVGITVELSRLKQVATEMAKMDEFYWIAMTTGDYDLLGEIVLPANRDLAEFVTEKLAPIEGIRSFRVLITPRFFKVWGDYRLPRLNGEAAATADSEPTDLP
jgi:Lrp/AsnC family transcriptional regulator for asnA, asnC and gidA